MTDAREVLKEMQEWLRWHPEDQVVADWVESLERALAPAGEVKPDAWILRTGNGDRVSLYVPKCEIPEAWKPLYASPPAAPQGWMPIDSAPKDGTDVLVLLDMASVLVAHIAWWRDEDHDLGFSAEDVGWWSYPLHSVTQEKLEGYREPRYWMPLPPPPAAAPKEGT